MDNLYDKYRKKEKEMNEYATMHKLETNEIYASDEEKDTEYFESHKLDRCEMADFLYNNFTSLSSKDKRLYLTKCLSSIQVKRELLKFELKHYKQIPQSMTIKDFTKKAESIFRRYQGKAGGFYIEDTDWDLHDSTSDRYRVESNQIFFVAHYVCYYFNIVVLSFLCVLKHAY